MNELVNLVYENDKGIFCDSRTIAEKFEKDHANILKVVDKLLIYLVDINGVNSNGVKNELIFIEKDYTDNHNQLRRCFEMNRQAFSLLVMRFTGQKALQWQVKFNDAFYNMETKIKELIIPQTKLEWMKLAVETEEKNEKLLIENKAMTPKAEFFDAVTDSKTAIEMAGVAKILDMGIGRNLLFKRLREHRVLRFNNTPYQKYVDNSCFRVVEQKYAMSDGSIRINVKTLVYQKGVDFIRNLLNGS